MCARFFCMSTIIIRTEQLQEKKKTTGKEIYYKKRIINEKKFRDCRNENKGKKRRKYFKKINTCILANNIYQTAIN